MTHYASIALVGSTVGAVLGLLLFSPYHTLVSIQYFTQAASLLSFHCPAMSTCPSWDEVAVPVASTSSDVEAKKPQGLLLPTTSTSRSRHTMDESKFISKKDFRHLSTELENLKGVVESLRNHVTGLQNEIAIIKRSMPRVTPDVAPKFFYTAKREKQ